MLYFKFIAFFLYFFILLKITKGLNAPINKEIYVPTNFSKIALITNKTLQDKISTKILKFGNIFFFKCNINHYCFLSSKTLEINILYLSTAHDFIKHVFLNFCSCIKKKKMLNIIDFEVFFLQAK